MTTSQNEGRAPLTLERLAALDEAASVECRCHAGPQNEAERGEPFCPACSAYYAWEQAARRAAPKLLALLRGLRTRWDDEAARMEKEKEMDICWTLRNCRDDLDHLIRAVDLGAQEGE